MYKQVLTVALLLAVLGTGDAVSVRRPKCRVYYRCTTEYNPVCGTDGITYHNSCYKRSFTCGSVATAYNGECIPPTPTPRTCRDDIMCTADYSPVCGSDGVTYSNQCVFDARTCGTGTTVVHSGECSSSSTPTPCGDIMCTDIYQPVCGTDGVTYGNACNLRARTCGSGVSVAHDGECSSSSTPTACGDIMCTDIYQPVCGTDGVTYGNACNLQARTCGSGVSVAHDGECSSSSTPTPCGDIMCTAIYQPVCGTDGVTYGNSCNLQARTCGSGVSVAHEGEC